MKGGRFSPLVLVGSEGMIETVLCISLVLPLAASLPGSDHGRLEDTFATVRMLRRSPTLCALCAASLVSLAALNPLSMAIGQKHGSVLRVFMDVGRPAVVWIASLTAHAASDGGYGEAWSTPKSWIELAAFAVISAGLFLYCSPSKSARTGERDAALPNAEQLLPSADQPCRLPACGGSRAQPHQ